METLTRRRRLQFTVVAVALPWMLILLFELGLRIGGYGSAYPLFTPHVARPEYLATNSKVAWRYFGSGPFTPTPELDLFRAQKQPGNYRIFMQGESSAQGFPYGHGGAPSRMLEQRLQAEYPDREIEVVNTALTAINSYALLDQADEIIAQQPDAVLIYAGHNEYYGALGVGSTRAFGGWRPLAKASLLLRHSRTAQLMEAIVSRSVIALRASGSADSPRTVMQLMAGDQQIPYGSARYQQGLDQFRANLSDLLARYRAHGIPVLIGTVASNERDQPPLISRVAEGTDSLAWLESYSAATAALSAGDTSRAAQALDAAMRIDSSAAALHWTIGRLHDLRGDSLRALASYRLARNYDRLRFRAPSAINEIIREEAVRHGAIIVETQRALARRSPGGSIGKSLMLEHLHPNLDGYFIIAEAFHEAIRQHRPRTPAARLPLQTRADIPVTAIDSMVGVYRTDRLVAGWPFRTMGSERIPIVDTLRPTGDVERLAQAVVVGNLPWPEATERLRDASERSGDYAQALRAARALSFEYSYSAEPYLDAARAALFQRRYDVALEYVNAANRRHETAKGVQLAGLLLLRQGSHGVAVSRLERATQLAPGDERISLSLRAARAIPGLEQARSATPRDTVVLYELAGAYALTQQYEKSTEVLAMLIRVAPNHVGGRTLMSKIPQ